MIYQQLANLPNVCKDVPHSYIKLKSYLESQKKSKNRLDLAEILNYCRASDLQMNKSESESALQFCVDLGVAVWRPQDKSIRDTVFLDPEFLISTFRSIFNISNSKNMDGVVSHRKLQKSLGETNFEQIIKLFRAMGLSYPLSDSVEIFPILVRGREKSVPVQKWLVDPKTTQEYIAYMLSFRNEIPKLEISKLIVGLLKMIDDKKIERKSQLVYLGRNNIVLPFSIKDGQIEKGSAFLMRIELFDSLEEECEQTSNHDVRLPICKHIIIHVQTGRKGCNAFAAAKLIKENVFDIGLELKQDEGAMCPKCRSIETSPAEVGLIDSNDLQLLKSLLKCTKGHEIPAADFKKWMLASGALSEEFQGNRTKKPSISQDMQNRRHLQIFLSSTFLDMKLVRESFTRFAQPIIEMEGRGLGFDVSFIDMRWGISEEESKNGDTIFRCLDGVRKADYFVCFPGSRYGWIPNRDSDLEWNKELIESNFSWVTKHPNTSATELEIQGACLSDDAQLAYRSFFYERVQKENFDQLSQFEKEDRQKQSRLKDAIRESFVVHEFTDVFQMIGQATNHITNAMRKDMMELNSGLKIIQKCKTKSFLLDDDEVSDRIRQDLMKHHKSLSEKQDNLLRRQINQGPLKNQVLLNMVIEEIVSFGIFEDLTMLLDSLLSPETAEELIVRILRQWERSYDANGVRDMLIVLNLASQTLGVSWQGISDYLFGNHEDSELILKSRALFALLLRFDVLGIASVEGVGHDRYYVQYPLLCWAIDQSYLSDRAEKGAAWAEYLKLMKCELKNEANEPIQAQICIEITNTVCKIYDLRQDFEDEPSEELLGLGLNEVFLEYLKNDVTLRRLLGDSAEKLGFQNQNEMWLRMLQTSTMATIQLAEVLSNMPQLLESIDECLSKYTTEQEQKGAGYWNSEVLYHLYCRRISVCTKLNRPKAEIEEFQMKADRIGRDAFGELNF